MNLIPFFAFGTVILQLAIIFLLVVLLVRFLFPTEKNAKRAAGFIYKNSILICLILVSSATLGSLYLSEIVLFPPCKLCWVQRIFMYPQVVILGVGYYLNDFRVKIYSFILSLIGFAFGVYHILVQFFPGTFKCTDEIANCALKQMNYFGYITIPVMSASVFALISLILLFSLKKFK